MTRFFFSSVLGALLWLVLSTGFAVAQQGNANNASPLAAQIVDVAALEAERDRLQAELVATLAERDRLEGELERARATLDAVRVERDSVAVELVTARETIIRLEQRILALGDDLDFLQGELRGVRVALTERNDELQSQLNVAQSETTRVTNRNNQLRQELAALRRELQVATAPVVCDYQQSLSALWEHRDFDQDHLAEVEAALEDTNGLPFVTIAYDDDTFWASHVGRDAANLRAYIRDMRVDGIAEDAVLVAVDGSIYVLFVCDCGVTGVYRLEKPVPVQAAPLQPAPANRSCPAQVTIRVDGGPDCTGSCAAARAAAAAARVCQ